MSRRYLKGLCNISPLMLEDNIIYLENAKNLMNIYFEFIDTECPHNLKEIPNKNVKKLLFTPKEQSNF